MNVHYRVELSQAERNELTAIFGGKHAVRKLKRRRFCWRLMEAAATRRLRCQPLLADSQAHPSQQPVG